MHFYLYVILSLVSLKHCFVFPEVQGNETCKTCVCEGPQLEAGHEPQVLVQPEPLSPYFSNRRLQLAKLLLIFQLQTFMCASEIPCRRGPKSTMIAGPTSNIFCETSLFRNAIVLGIIYLPMELKNLLQMTHRDQNQQRVRFHITLQRWWSMTKELSIFSSLRQQDMVGADGSHRRTTWMEKR